MEWIDWSLVRTLADGECALLRTVTCATHTRTRVEAMRVDATHSLELSLVGYRAESQPNTRELVVLN